MCQPYITELDLQRLQLPATAAAFLLEKMDAYEPRAVDLDVAGLCDENEPPESGALDYESFLAKFLE
jgi:CHASE2 domain-containing sensor protein